MNLPDALTLATLAFLLVYVRWCCRYTVPRDEQTRRQFTHQRSALGRVTQKEGSR